MVPTDASAISRVVGFYEYGNALNNFDRLVDRLDEAELAAVNEIIAERDEYTIYTRDSGDGRQDSLSTIDGDTADTSIAGSRAVDNETAGNERRGLAWVMALARLEFGAMLATFSNTSAPFLAVKPTALESDAYPLLLLDGARDHYQALSNDPFLPQVARTSPADPVVLTYARRLVLARSMLNAAMQLGRDRYSSSEWQQMAYAKENLDKLQAGLTLKIQLYLREQSRQVLNTSTTQDYTEACGAMLRAEERELASGQATVERIRK